MPYPKTVILSCLLALAAVPAATAQEAEVDLNGAVEMNLPGDLPLAMFADLVAEELGWTLLYREQDLEGRTVTLRFNGELTRDAMRQLLAGALVDANLRLTALGDDLYRISPTMQDNGQMPPLQMTVQLLDLENAPAGKVAELLQDVLVNKLVGDGFEMGERVVRVRPDERSNTIVVLAPPEMQDLAEGIVEKLDRPGGVSSRRVETYKLKNSTAGNLIRTLRQVAGLPPGPRERGDAPLSSFGDEQVDPLGDGRQNDLGLGDLNNFAPPQQLEQQLAQQFDEYGEPVELAAVGRQNERPILVADRHTNSIIVVADADTQSLYGQLIAQLDERRPQVQIEATLVSLNTSDDNVLGVEFGDSRSVNSGRLVTFSQFGVSTLETTPELGVTGSLLPTNTLGFTAALLDGDFADVVLQAFAEESEARVLSSPVILVNDNEVGQLGSIREEPVVETVQGEVIATTSFKEFVKAGTQIKVRPHISEGGYLQLEYEIEVNTFAGGTTLSDGIPPPRQTDKVGSRVTIPDGDTIVVGGLTRKDDGTIVSKIPLLGDIPVLGAAFRRTVDTSEQTTLFVFLRPRILSDDDFEDLRRISRPAIRDSGLDVDLPHHARPAAVQELPVDAPVLIVD